MATLELSPYTDHFDVDEIKALAAAVKEISSASFELADEGESVVIERDLDDDIFVDFQDRLDANDANADVYLPVEFEEIVKVGETRFGSAHALMILLENLKEDFFVEDEDDDAELETDADVADDFDFDEDDAGAFTSDDVSPIEMKDEQLRHIWRALYKGAQTSVRQGLCMFVRA